MEVELVNCTTNPLEVVSRAAGTCYGKDDLSTTRVEHCMKSGHLSVFEHVSMTFKVEGISRACSHQLVRHRLASYSQESQRYCKIDVDSNDWYVTPKCFAEDVDSLKDAVVNYSFDFAMRSAASSYKAALENGIRPEDARYLLPEATKTNLMVTMNFREFLHFYELRSSNRAQWEIRDLADKMRSELESHSPQYKTLMDMIPGDEE